MRLWRRLRIWLVVGPLVLVAGGCSGGGDDRAGLDQEFRPTPGERNIQFTGAAKLRLAGTLAVPSGRASSVPGQQLSWDEMVHDAREALGFLTQRQEVDATRVAVIGHDMAGPIALKLAAVDDRVKSVTLLSAPGRPLVDVWADGLRATHGPASADAFRALIDGLVVTGSLPGREAVAPEYQTSLPPGQDPFFKAMFSVDPLADAAAVKVPVLIALGERSTQVSSVDATLLGGSLGGRTETVVAADSSSTFQQFRRAPVRVSDPTNMDDHGLGPPVADAPRDQPTIDRIASFVGTSLQARPA